LFVFCFVQYIAFWNASVVLRIMNLSE